MHSSLPTTEPRSHARYYFGPSRLLTKRIQLRSQDGTLDFTITGGNGVQPIQVASVVWASQAYSQGMRPGDQIISVNGIAFDNDLPYAKAVGVSRNFYSPPKSLVKKCTALGFLLP